MLEEDTWKTQNSELHLEKSYSLVLFSHQQQPLSDSQGHRPPSTDNNIWHHFPKVDIDKFDGSNPLGWVTEMEHYFALHRIIGMIGMALKMLCNLHCLESVC